VSNPGPHRALNDVREALEFARGIRNDMRLAQNAIQAALR
jgi:hypothetical protein